MGRPFSRPRLRRRCQSDGSSIASRNPATRPASPRETLMPRRASGRASRQGQGQDLRIGGGNIGPAKAFEAGLDEFAARAGPGPEHRTAIAVGGRLAGQPGFQIGPAGRDRIFGAQAKLRARCIAGQIEPGPDILAAEVEKGGGILQDRRLDPAVASTDQMAKEERLRVLKGGCRPFRGCFPDCDIHIHACGSICTRRAVAKARRGGDPL